MSSDEAGGRALSASDAKGRLVRAHRAGRARVKEWVIRVFLGSFAARWKAERVRREGAEEALRKLKCEFEDLMVAHTAALIRVREQWQYESRERRRAQEDLLAISHREQRRIGRDLHDTLGQQLTGIALLSESLSRALRSKFSEEADHAARISQLLREAIGQTRRLAHGLMPVDLASGGLGMALRHLAEDTGRLFDLSCQITGEHTPVHNHTIATHLYHITQEALHNAKRHGHARHVWIRLSKEGNRGRMSVVDDGHGLPPGPERGTGMGLRVMRYRAESMGGTMSIEPHEQGGTTVTITFCDSAPAG